MNPADRIIEIKRKLPPHVKLIAVSKTKSIDEIQSVYDTGHFDFGENYVQELLTKQTALATQIHWHYIGHLQSNKVKYIAPFVHLIHSVDSLKLLKEINKEALKNNRIIDYLLEIHIAEEESKSGLVPNQIKNLISSNEFILLKNVRICGLMGMATLTDNESQIRSEFKEIKRIFDELKSSVFAQCEFFNTLSMGMTDDYKIAIEEGSTMIRIGSAIFGTRQYII